MVHDDVVAVWYPLPSATLDQGIAMNTSVPSRPAVAARSPDRTAARPVATPLDPAAVERQVLGGLDFAVPKAPLPGGYAGLMALLAGCLVLMPVAYVALVAFLGWVAAWHAYQAVATLGTGPYFLYHVPMAVAGGLMVFFLIKPVSFRSKEDLTGVITLAEADQPLLYAAVEKLCAATGARPPLLIEVDCEANAHARFHRFRDSVGGGETILRLGLPLVAGLTARQFAGVVGHELGHFAQRRGMAGSFLVRRLMALFARVVFHRDRFDLALRRLGRRRSGGARLAHGAAVALVEPMRGLLWLMLTAGTLLTCGVLRRMEHDADDVMAHVCGGTDFVRTSKLLVFLDLASRRARADLADALTHQRLADDLPRLIVANAKQLREHRRDVLKLLDAGTTEWFDTHPCHADRVAHVGRLDAAGLFACDLPASRLFNDFRGLCRRATDAVYAGAIKPADLAAAKVVPTDELAADRAAQRAAGKVLRRYFRGHVVAGRPIFPDPAAAVAPVRDVARAASKLAEARQSVEDAGNSGDALAATIRRYAEASANLPVAQAQVALGRVFGGNPKARGLIARGERLLAEHGPARDETAAILAPFEQTGRDRLTLALRLVRTDAVAAGLGTDGPQGRAAVAKLLPVCAALQACLAVTDRLGELLPAIRILGSVHNPRQPFPPLAKQVVERTREAAKLLGELEDKLADVPYPFAHGTAGVTLAAHVVRKRPSPADPAAVHNEAFTALDRYHTLTFRSLAVLTQWAERAETAVGLPPLGEVEEPADDKKDADDPRAAESARRSRRYWLGYGGRAAAGLALVAGLVGLSVSPPSLPIRPWDAGSGSPAEYRPAAFHVASGLSTFSTRPFPSFQVPPMPVMPMRGSRPLPGFRGGPADWPPTGSGRMPAMPPSRFDPPAMPGGFTPVTPGSPPRGPGFGTAPRAPYVPAPGTPYSPPAGGGFRGRSR